MRHGSEKLGVMQSSDRLENEMLKNMRQLTILQSFGLSYITWGILYITCTAQSVLLVTIVVYAFVRCVYCSANAAASSWYYAILPQSQWVT